jgi:hypothetical protein
MIQAMGSGVSLVVILAVVARGRLLLGSFPNDVELLVGELSNCL